MRNKITLLVLVISIFLIGNASALTILPINDFQTNPHGYGTANIKNFLGIGGDLMKVTLTDNTNYCMTNCSAQGTAEIYQSTSLLDNVYFKDLKNGKDTSLNYKIYLQDGTIKGQQTIQTCSDNRVYDSYNKTYSTVKNCKNDFVVVDVPNWVNYDGRKLNPGNYTWKIEGKKGIYDDVDWIGSFSGIKVNQWAIWNSSFSESLIGVYKFDGNGNESINKTYNIGLLTGVDYSLPGINGSAIGKFNSVSTIAIINNLSAYNFSISKNFSISFWFNRTDAFSDSYFFGKGDTSTSRGYSLSIGNGRRLVWNFVDVWGSSYCQGLTNTTAIPNAFGWTNVVVTYNGSGGGCSGINFYFNGSLLDKTVGGGGSPSNIMSSANFSMGNGISTALTLGGSLDEMYIFNRVLSQSEINYLSQDTFYSIGIDYSPTINLISPINYYNTTSNLVNFNCSGSDDNKIMNVSFWLNGIRNYTKNWGTSNFTELYLPRTLGDGNYNWTCSGDDNATITQTTFASNYTLTIDTTPPNISIVAPFNQTYTTNYSINSTISIDLNATITDPHLQSCWIYNGTANVTVTCGQNLTINTGFGAYQFIFYANDSLGNTANQSISANWNYNISENSVTYNAITSETKMETFSLNITSTIGAISSVKLNYNGTNYSGNNKAYSSGNYILNSSFNIPVISSPQVNESFYFIFTIGTNQYISTTYNQIVNKILFYQCNVTNSQGLTLNFTTYDTINNNLLNSSFQGTFSFALTGSSSTNFGVFNYSDTTNTNSNFMFCLNSSGNNLTLNSFINYYAPNYLSRSYILSNAIIGNFTQNIPLFLDATGNTSIITFTLTDQNYVRLSGAIISVQEWNVGTNTYSTIGMFTTGNDGTGILNLHLYDTWYRTIVTYNGNIVATTPVQKINSNTWNIIASIGVGNPYSPFNSISHGLTFDNSTNITTFTWADLSGYTQQGCLTVNNLTNLGAITLFNSCMTTVAGSINYLLPSDGSYSIYGTIYLIPIYNVSQIVDNLMIQLGTSPMTKTISPFGKVLSFIFIGTAGIIGIAAGSVLLGVFLLFGSIFLSMQLGWLNITEGILWGIITILIIIIFSSSRRYG